MALAILAPSDLKVDGNVGHALRDGAEILIVRSAHRRHLGCHAESEIVLQEIDLVTQHGGETEIIGIRALKIDRERRGLQVAEGGDVATRRKAEQRHVGRTQTRRVAELLAAAEIHIDVSDHAAQRARVDYRLGEQTRRGGVHHQSLTVGVCLLHGDVVGDEIDVIDRTLQIIARAEVDVTADTEREFVVLGGEDELRIMRLLETRAERLLEILTGARGGHVLAGHRLLHGASGYRIGLFDGDHVYRRPMPLDAPAASLSRCAVCAQHQIHDNDQES